MARPKRIAEVPTYGFINTSIQVRNAGYPVSEEHPTELNECP
jgi:hypothetical protein